MILLEGTPGFSYLVTLLPNVFSLASVVGMWTCLRHESPIYLWVTGHKDEAVQLIRKLAGESLLSESERSSIMKSDSILNSHSSIGPNGTVELLKNSVFRRILLLTMTLSFLQQFTGINDILVYSGENIGTNLAGKFGETMLLGFACACSALMIIFIDRRDYVGFKRLTLLKVGAVGMFVCNALILGLWNDYPEVWYLNIPFVFFFEISLGPVMWLYISELAAPVSMGISTSCNWLGVLFINFGSVSDDPNLRRSMFGVYCLGCVFVRST